MLEDDVDVTFAGDVPDRLAEAPRLLGPVVELGRVALRQLAPALEVLAVDDALALLVIAVVLISLDDDVVADLPSVHLGADRADDARGFGAGDVERLLVH